MLGRTAYFVREHVGLLKLQNTYDILDPASGAQLAVAAEEASGWSVLLGLFLGRRLVPTRVRVYAGSVPGDAAKLVFSLHKGPAFLRSRIEVREKRGIGIGELVSRVLTVGGALDIHNERGRPVAALEGNWIGWNFKYRDPSGREIGEVTKKWAGIGKELFTTADNYMVSFAEAPSERTSALLLAAVLAIDMIYKEGGD
jgi:uncharacterized protein YxjI